MEAEELSIAFERLRSAAEFVSLAIGQAEQEVDAALRCDAEGRPDRVRAMSKLESVRLAIFRLEHAAHQVQSAIAQSR